MTKSDLAFVFPGQGSQKVGMLSDMAEHYSVIKETFDAASEVLGYDLWSLVQGGSQEELNMTEKTQPMLLAASVANWRAWCEMSDVRPAMMAGHSLGEWSALVCAGVIKFEDAIKLVQLRGRFMQEAVPAGEGAMAAIIGLDDAAIEKVCEESAQDGVVSAVNYNSPGQVVIAGSAAAVDRAIEGCKAAGAKRAMPLAVSAPFHTSLMQPAADRLASYIQETEFSAPEIPVVHNVHGKTEVSPEAIKQLMIDQISAPVLWVDCVKQLASSGVAKVVECGPGKVLSGLCKRIDKSLASSAGESPADFDKVKELVSE